MYNEETDVDLSGKVALVTSTADELGFQLARTLVQAGAHVHLVNPGHRDCMRQTDLLRGVGTATGHVVDLQSGIALMHFARLIVEEVPRLNILVSNARIARPEGSTALFDQSVLEKYEILGDLCLAQELVPSLRDGSTVADPARVILVGQFEKLRAPRPPSTKRAVARKPAGTVTHPYAEGIAQRFLEQRINLNFIDLASRSADAALASESVCQSLLWLSSVGAVRVRGEVAPVAAVAASRGAA